MSSVHCSTDVRSQLLVSISFPEVTVFLVVFPYMTLNKTMFEGPIPTSTHALSCEQSLPPKKKNAQKPVFLVRISTYWRAVPRQTVPLGHLLLFAIGKVRWLWTWTMEESFPQFMATFWWGKVMMRCRGVLEIPYVQSHMFDGILGLMVVRGINLRRSAMFWWLQTGFLRVWK